LSTVIGGWLSRDPIGENGGMNVVSYIGNDPCNYVDPLGLKKLTKEEGAKALDDGLRHLNTACEKACVPNACCTPKKMQTGGKDLNRPVGQRLES
jgi:hypothetical protein